jgi:hypothetical protein
MSTVAIRRPWGPCVHPVHMRILPPVTHRVSPLLAIAVRTPRALDLKTGFVHFGSEEYHMRAFRIPTLMSAAALALASVTTFAAASHADPWQSVCAGGEIASGTYQNLWVTGQCTVPADAHVTVVHNLKVAADAAFIADQAPSTIHIGGNVVAGPRSFFGLGCTPAHGCETSSTFSDDTVGGNITLKYVYDAALNGVEVWGSVRSKGGGAGFVADQGQFVPFSVKDDIVHGNLSVRGLKTTWFGVIRSQIDGNVTLKYIKNDDPDGNEVVHDTIGGNLVCLGMSPHPQFGDAVEGAPPGYQYSTVGGRVVGQCDFVLNPDGGDS